MRLLPLSGVNAAEQLERGGIDVAVAHLRALPNAIELTTLLRDPFVAVMHRDHPLARGPLSLEAYAAQRHVLVSPRGDTTGAIDRILVDFGLRRRIVLLVATYLALPAALAGSDLVAAVPSRTAQQIAGIAEIAIQPLPVDLAVTVSMAWHRRASSEPAQAWFRSLLIDAAADAPANPIPAKAPGGQTDGIRSAELAGARLPGVAGQLRDAAHVDADRRQGAAGAGAAGEPLVARAAVPDRPRSDDVADAVWRRLVPGRFRLHRPRLRIELSDGRRDGFALAPRPVAEFYASSWAGCAGSASTCAIRTMPVEVADPVRVRRRTASMPPTIRMRVNRFWRALALADRVFTEFRGRFLGKASPVHFFWGSFDLAVTRFSGRRAPPPPSNPLIPDAVNREAYSHEVSSCGFWPGNGGFGQAAFYCYAYPQPAGFGEAPITAAGAYYSQEIGEFILPYDAVRQAERPRELLLQFLQETYAAAADLGGWDRAALER